MQIDVRKPGLQVLLRKNIKRTTTSGSTPVSARFSGQASVVDLTPWLAEGHSVRVSKSVRAPAGTFGLQLADRISPDVLDTLYSVIEPMDSIEIRMADSATAPGTDMPIMMRGFVTDVEREEGMDASGRPTRSVRVDGHDYGKILQIMQFFMTASSPSDASALITSFPFFTKYGDFSNIMEAGAFVKALFAKVVNPYLDTMRKSIQRNPIDDGKLKEQEAALKLKAQTLESKALDLIEQGEQSDSAGNSDLSTQQYLQAKAAHEQAAAARNQAAALDKQIKDDQVASVSPIFDIQTDISVTGAKVSPFGIGTFSGGNVHQLIQSHGDIGPWNEFFIEDRDAGAWGDAGPYAVYRPNPFMDPATNQMLLTGAKLPAVTSIDSSDVVSMTVGRSDSNVANYFWVDAPRYLLNYGSTARALASASSDVYVTDYGNVDPTLYGVRRMHEVSNQAALAETDNGNGTAAGSSRNSNDASALDWINQRRTDLRAQNQDNIVLESGTMRLKGRSSIRAGTYLYLVRGQMAAYYYVTQVTHDFTPFGNWFAQVTVERGTGFVQRIQSTNTQQAPYLSEMVWKDN